MHGHPVCGPCRGILKHINNYTDRARAELTKLHVRQVSVKTVFDLPLEAPQPADHTTIMVIPAGDEPQDQVLPGIQYEFPYEDQEDLPLKWTDVIFNEIVKLSKAEQKNSLLQYHYGTDRARMKAKAAAGTLSGAVGGTAIGAAIAGGIGVLGRPIGIAVGAGVGGVTGMITGLASGLDKSTNFKYVLCMCVFVCMYVYMYLCMHVCVSEYIME